MSCAAQVFSNVSSTAWACLKAKAEAQGFTVGGDSGSISKSGFSGTWNYDAAAQTLTLQCTGAPFLFSCGDINGKIHDVVTGTGCLT
jgi:hypothetical protein